MSTMVEINAENDSLFNFDLLLQEGRYAVYGMVPYIDGASVPSNMVPQCMVEVTRIDFSFPGTSRTASAPFPGNPYIFRAIIRQTVSFAGGVFTRLFMRTDDATHYGTQGEWQQIAPAVAAMS